MKRESGITLVSLVVTVIVLIILAGVSINLVLGENGILTMAKKAKENTELAQIKEQEDLNTIYEYLEKEGESASGGEISYDAIAKLNNFKKKVADYIEEAGGIKPEYTADTETFGEKIKGIVTEVTKDATATAADIASGKTAWVNGNKITGTGLNARIAEQGTIEVKGISPYTYRDITIYLKKDYTVDENAYFIIYEKINYSISSYTVNKESSLFSGSQYSIRVHNLNSDTSVNSVFYYIVVTGLVD